MGDPPDLSSNSERGVLPDARRDWWANDVVAAMTASIGEGVGAIAVDGVLLDLAHVKMARTILDRAELVERAEAKGVRT